MGAIFETKIRHARLTFSPFSSEQMADIGNVVLESIKDRILLARNADDAPAKPLAIKYADWKSSAKNKYPGKSRLRDWSLRGKTLRSLKVKVASEDRATLGPTDPQSQMIVAVQNRRQRQWAVSPKNLEVLYAAVQRTLLQSRVVRLVRSAA